MWYLGVVNYLNFYFGTEGRNVWSENVYDISTVHPPLFIDRKIYENMRGGVKTILGGETDKIFGEEINEILGEEIDEIPETEQDIVSTVYPPIFIEFLGNDFQINLDQDIRNHQEKGSITC